MSRQRLETPGVWISELGVNMLTGIPSVFQKEAPFALRVFSAADPEL